MDLHIFNILEAIVYQPKNSTYAIRIASKRRDLEEHLLQPSGFYTIVEYLFHDVDPAFSKNDSLIFDEPLAQKILDDFKQQGLGKETLLVHCMQGENRSPAVAIALNEIYSLGHDTEELKKKFPEANWHVYKTLLKVAKEKEI